MQDGVDRPRDLRDAQPGEGIPLRDPSGRPACRHPGLHRVVERTRVAGQELLAPPERREEEEAEDEREQDGGEPTGASRPLSHFHRKSRRAKATEASAEHAPDVETGVQQGPGDPDRGDRGLVDDLDLVVERREVRDGVGDDPDEFPSLVEHEDVAGELAGHREAQGEDGGQGRVGEAGEEDRDRGHDGELCAQPHEGGRERGLRQEREPARVDRQHPEGGRRHHEQVEGEGENEPQVATGQVLPARQRLGRQRIEVATLDVAGHQAGPEEDRDEGAEGLGRGERQVGDDAVLLAVGERGEDDGGRDEQHREEEEVHRQLLAQGLAEGHPGDEEDLGQRGSGAGEGEGRTGRGSGFGKRKSLPVECTAPSRHT